MPFTVAHTICALPFYRRRFFITSAVTIGLMAPDFEYFLIFGKSSTFGHTLIGLVGVAMPIGLCLYGCWNWLLAPYLWTHYQGLLGQRSQLESGWQGWWQVIASLGIGICLHMFADSFTEVGSLWARIFPWLYQQSLWGLPMTMLLQYGLSFVGMLALVLYLGKKGYEHAPALSRQQWCQLGKTLVTIGSIATLTLCVGQWWQPLSTTNDVFYVGVLLIRWLSLVAITAVLGVMSLRIKSHRRKKQM